MAGASSTFRSSPALEKTIQLLAKTNNEAALDVLVPALDNPHVAIQEAALRAILERRAPSAQREVLQRLHKAPESWRQIIESKKGRLTQALRDGLLGSEPQLCANACQAVLWFREYDLVPSLLAALEDDSHPHARLTAQTLVKLAEQLCDEINASPRDYSDRRDPQLIRQRVVSNLESSVRRFAQHHSIDVISAFLLLTQRENVTLKQILQDPHHGTFVPLVDALAHNERPAVIALLLSFLDDPHAPSAAMATISRRSDAKFVHALLRKAGHSPSHAAAANLKRLESLAWLRTDGQFLDELHEADQQALVQLTLSSGVRRAEVFKIVEHLLKHGKQAGRIAAAKALAQFNGGEAAALVTYALEDSDPRVQAAVLPQIRQRGTPGALSRLIEMVDSPHECVRLASREGLAEFSFERFLASFDMLEDDVRRSTATLVRKINPDAVARLAEELRVPLRQRRLRALSVAQAMNLVADLEATMIELLHDEDHLVRGEAARSLAYCPTAAASEALQRALSDRSIAVQEAAHESLGILEKSALRGTATAGEARS